MIMGVTDVIKSMTGYGRSERLTEDFRLNIELKSVNHRYLDLGIKMPRKFNVFEAKIRNLVREYVQRGKIDMFINFEDYHDLLTGLRYNGHIAREYLEYCKAMSEEFGIVNDIKVSNLSRFPEVLVMEESNTQEDKIWVYLEAGIREACENFVKSKEVEGERLLADIYNKLDCILLNLKEIELRSPELIAEYRNRLKSKVEDLLGNTNIDEQRIITEVTIYADKIAIDEEIVRLHSHILATKKELDSEESVGRKLDFIAQELNREANTILSKSGDTSISEKAIVIKTEIEKIREQVQNIE